MAKKIDLTGQKFGKLIVLGFSHIGNHRESFWKCQCDCEKHTILLVSGSKLRTGHTQSCGCLRGKSQKGKIKDLTGQKFGKLTVIGLDHIDHGAYWKCVCDCNNHTEVVVNGTKLRRGDTKSCGCLIKEKAHEKLVDLTGKRFGRLLVLEYNQNTRKWLCRCTNDNNEIEVSAGSLTSGRTKSCGCLHEEKLHERFVDITGLKFNNLLVKELNNKQDGRYYWKCICLNCGKETIVERSKLGFTKSCGCLDISHSGSSDENEILKYICKWFPNIIVEIHSRMLNGKEIDMYFPEYKVGVEYNGSAYHATENGLWENKDKYYHRDKFLLAKEKGIHLITVFDKDYIDNKWIILQRIKHILEGNKKFFIPVDEIVYTDNDYDIGTWLIDYGYEEVGQIEPSSFIYNKFLVYRCGKTQWKLNKGE